MNAKILLVDDDLLVLASLQKLLESRRYKVRIARSGEEAIRVFCLEDFDLVISDIKMPQTNGFETVKRIKYIANRMGKNTAYLFLTGYADDAVTQKVAAFGMGQVILKPADAHDLLQSVEREILLLRRETEQMDSNAEIIRPGSRVGQWHYPEGKFSFEKYVLLKETNLLGGADYDYYHSWQSEIKDVLLLQHPESGPWLKDNPHIRLVVHSSNQKFLAQTKYGDRVRVEAVTREIRFCSFIMSFRFYLSDGDTLLGTAWQKICAFNSKNDKLCRLPRLVLDLIEPLQEEGSPVPVSST